MTDDNDWRVTISLADPAHVGQVRQSFSVHEVEEDVSRRLGRSIAVGAGDSQIFLYAGTRAAAVEAERVARDVLTSRGIEAGFALHRWHPVAEDWEDPDIELPQTAEQLEAERHRLDEAETAESLKAGVALWEARAEFPSHREAVEMAARLRSEGRPVIRRWKFLVVSANNEDEAAELADQIRREAPQDATVRAQPAGALVPFISF